jgi:hypothetical protein
MHLAQALDDALAGANSTCTKPATIGLLRTACYPLGMLFSCCASGFFFGVVGRYLVATTLSSGLFNAMA